MKSVAARYRSAMPPRTGTRNNRFPSSTMSPSVAIDPGDPAAVPPIPPSTTPSQVQTVNLVNSGAGPLDVTSITDNCAAASFTVTYPPAPFTLNVCEIAPISARYDGTVVPGTQSCTVTITTNVGTRTLSLTGTSQ